MRYGYFSEDPGEYIITDPKTPTPWINYISNNAGYCGIVSQTGGGFSFYKDPRDRRITKYRYNSIPWDRPGRYFYIKNENTGEYWSPTWQPVLNELHDYRCHHGQGYTEIASVYKTTEHHVCYFVPEDHTCEIWRLEVKNNSREMSTLSLYSYCEFTLWSEPQSRNIQWSLHLTRCFFQNNKIIYPFIEPHPAFSVDENKNYNPVREGMAFAGINLRVNDFDCSRDTFIGPYRSETNPGGVKRDRLSGSRLEGGIPCAALRTHCDLNPGEKISLIVVLGFASTLEQADSMHTRFSDSGIVADELEKVKKRWKNYCAVFPVTCPDKDITSVISTWNPYQCKTTFDWSRYISFYENGEGRGLGVRDSCQDTLSVCTHIPEEVKKRIIDIVSSCQFENGSCYHQYFPLDKQGDLSGFSDDHLWLIVMVYFYITETGDFSILDTEIPFPQKNTSLKLDLKKATLYEHLLLSIEYTQHHLGPHGLPLILVADWNDTLHLWMTSEKPESVFVAELFVFTCHLLAGLAEKTGKTEDAHALIETAQKMADVVNRYCWDGEWYLRGFGNKKIGSRDNVSAKIFLNSQVWAVISGIAQGSRAIQCMDSVRKYLYTPQGIKLISPPFDHYDNDHGLISRYIRGRKENGIFAHAQSWAIIAESLLGRSDYAYDYYRTMLPAKRNDMADILKTEPYVYCQTISSDDSLFPGEGANSWLTGTASWMYIAFTQYILGIQPSLDGLMVNPCLPGTWQGFNAERTYRGCRYYINCRRTGRSFLRVNGTDTKGSCISSPSDEVCRIDIEI